MFGRGSVVTVNGNQRLRVFHSNRAQSKENHEIRNFVFDVSVLWMRGAVHDPRLR